MSIVILHFQSLFLKQVDEYNKCNLLFWNSWATFLLQKIINWIIWVFEVDETQNESCGIKIQDHIHVRWSCNESIDSWRRHDCWKKSSSSSELISCILPITITCLISSWLTDNNLQQGCTCSFIWWWCRYYPRNDKDGISFGSKCRSKSSDKSLERKSWCVNDVTRNVMSRITAAWRSKVLILL